ncbi:MAG: oligosaccharide flippase family protein [Chitinophagaceae bacterium]
MSLKKHINVTVLSQIVVVSFTFLTSVLLSRILGADVRGDYALFTSSVALVVVWLGFSFPASIIYFVSSNKLKPNSIFYTLLLFSGITAIFLFFFVSGLGFFEKQTLIFPKEHYSLTWKISFAIAFLITAMNNIVIAFLNTQKKFYHLSVLQIIFSIITFSIYLFVFISKTRVGSAFFSWAVIITYGVVVLQFLVNLFYYFKYVPHAGHLEWLPRKAFVALFKFSTIAWLCNAFQFLSYKIDFWIISAYHGNADLGIYSVGVSLVQMLWLLPNAVTTVLYTYMSGYNEKKSEELTVMISGVIFWIALLGGILFAALLYFLIPIIYGVEFKNAVWVVFLTMPGVILMAYPIILSTFFASKGKIIYNLYSTLICFIVIILFDFILIPTYSMYGAAIASAFAYASYIITHTFLFLKKFDKEQRYSFLSFFKIDIKKLIHEFNISK